MWNASIWSKSWSCCHWQTSKSMRRFAMWTMLFFIRHFRWFVYCVNSISLVYQVTTNKQWLIQGGVNIPCLTVTFTDNREIAHFYRGVELPCQWVMFTHGGISASAALVTIAGSINRFYYDVDSPHYWPCAVDIPTVCRQIWYYQCPQNDVCEISSDIIQVTPTQRERAVQSCPKSAVIASFIIDIHFNSCQLLTFSLEIHLSIHLCQPSI